MKLGGILTAMVTPFDRHGELDEDATVRLIHELLDGGSDGLVVAGTTGEAPTLTDEEKARLWQLAVEESGDAPVIAGTGTYDTRHSAELTERATEIGRRRRAGRDARTTTSRTGAGSWRISRRWRQRPT